tara:strand:+ start:731 stop:892 length:162 start_codon:yes stop_codon:yes gene_type:complete
MEKKYRIEELCTSGWQQQDDDTTNLTKEEATKRAQDLIDEGLNPNRLRIVPIS